MFVYDINKGSNTNGIRAPDGLNHEAKYQPLAPSTVPLQDDMSKEKGHAYKVTI